MSLGRLCIEVSRKVQSPNYTLNLLLSLNGAEYYNIIDGPTNTIEFWNFFEEAANAANITTGRPVLEVGGVVVMDNLAVHHYDGGDVLEENLADMGIELISTPIFSPDLNPTELSFNKVKCLLNVRLADNVNENLKVAVGEVGSVSSRECLDAPAFLATFTAGRTGLVACP